MAYPDNHPPDRHADHQTTRGSFLQLARAVVAFLGVCCLGPSTPASPQQPAGGRSESGGADDVKAVGQQLSNATRAIARGQSEAAIRILGECIASFPAHPDAYYLRGREHFRVGRPAASVEDFDRLIELVPARRQSLWERGISCYYADQFDKGAEQFARYQEFDNADVENAIWHFLCVSRQDGFQQARNKLLPVKHDARIPMQEVYQLFAGKLTADELLKTAGRGQRSAASKRRSLYYAHLYAGLYLEVSGQINESQRWIRRADTEYRIEGYMGDVARVHRLLRAASQPSLPAPVEQRLINAASVEE